ncbi:hypothetical protein EJD97_023742 [Solanum chilense]|uniref:Uncharacterized protein n=1 Tax=Solanum chilense TaxID=4083 RepID=A0A6N2C5R3_SOLCI|nr:hypothetical protein EJD97_023742 [Solanum chilense]
MKVVIKNGEEMKTMKTEKIKKRMMTTEKRRNCKNGLSSPSSFHLPYRIPRNFPCNIKQLLFFSGANLR